MSNIQNKKNCSITLNGRFLQNSEAQHDNIKTLKSVVLYICAKTD